MNGIKEINIKIIDVLDNERTLINEKTEIQNPIFIVNGSDDKFVSLMTTELHFNLLVTSNLEAVFFHLFTGVESRYKVIFEDITDVLNTVVVWAGFLLPEQFTEPFKYSDFFVNFVATDGIGQLKNRYLNDSFYANKASILSVINQCLISTGLRLPILFAPAIENAGFDLNYKDLEVNTISYIDKDKKINTFKILENILISIGCRLFQYKNQWVIVGLNRINDATITFKKYTTGADLKLNYISEVILVRPILNKKFLANPNLSVITPLRNVTTTWDKKFDKNLIPLDAVTHYPANYTTDFLDRTVKYWTLTTDKNITFLVWLLTSDPNFDYSTIDLNSYYQGLKSVPNRATDEVVSGPFVFFNTINETILATDLPANYVSINSFYVKGSTDLERFATLEIEFNAAIAIGVTDTQINNAIKEDATNFVDHFFFAITYKKHKNQPIADETLYLSNFADVNTPAGIYDFKLSHVNGALKGILKLEKILLLNDGYYSLRLYPAVTNAFLIGRQIFTKCNFTLKTTDKKKIENTRNIGYSTSKEVAVFHSDSQMEISTRRFSFSDAIKTQAAAGTLIPLEVQVANRFYTNTPVLTNGVLWYTAIVVGLSDDDYNKIQNGYEVFIKQFGTSNIIALTPFSFAVVDSLADGGKVLIQYNYDAVNSGAIYIAANDILYLKLNTNSNNTIDYADHWLTKWKRFGETETIGYLEAINAIYHGCLYSFNLTISGTYTGFLTPFDLVDFKYKGERRYTPVKMELNLTEGTTSVTLVESKYTSLVLGNDNTVLQLEDGGGNLVTVKPVILIESTAVGTSLFVYNWTLQTNYTFTGFALVNAVITATQFTNSIANNGTATGLQKTATITNSSGVQVFNFPMLIGAEGGWWQLQMVQDGVVSNITEVQVAPTVTLPTQRIEIASIYIGDVFNITGKYSVNYIGFSQTIVTQSLQKFDINTQVPIGAAIDTVINNSLSEIDIVFPSGGSWRVTVLADGKVSNEVAWLTIII